MHELQNKGTAGFEAVQAFRTRVRIHGHAMGRYNLLIWGLQRRQEDEGRCVGILDGSRTYVDGAIAAG